MASFTQTSVPAVQLSHFPIPENADQALDRLLVEHGSQTPVTRVMSPTHALQLEPPVPTITTLALQEPQSMALELWGLRSGNMPCERCATACPPPRVTQAYLTANLGRGTTLSL